MNISEFEQQQFITAANTSLNRNIDIFISHVGFETTLKDREKETSSTSYCLYFIVKGTILFTIDNQTVKLGKGCCFLLPPARETSYIPFKNTEAKYYWITFYGKEAFHYLTQMGFDNKTLFHKLSTAYFNQIHKILYNTFFIPQQNKKIIDFYFMECFFSVSKLVFLANQSADTANYKKTSNHIEKALIYINDHYTEETLSLKELASHLFIHENYLSSLFKSTMGISFKEYVTQKRMQKAMSLIRNNVSSIIEIANAVGIPDVSYFSKVFKKANAIPPSKEIEKAKNM